MRSRLASPANCRFPDLTPPVDSGQGNTQAGEHKPKPKAPGFEGHYDAMLPWSKLDGSDPEIGPEDFTPLAEEMSIRNAFNLPP
jgi:hypothetical protein